MKKKNQLDATYYFIVLLIRSTCFGHYYVHHQELTTIMLITTLVVSFYKDGRGSANVKLCFLVVYVPCGAYGWGEGGVWGLGGETGWKETNGGPNRRWMDNTKMDLQEVGCGYMDWIGLAQDIDRWWTLVSALMNLRVPWNVGDFLTTCKPVSFSRRTLHHGVSK